MATMHARYAVETAVAAPKLHAAAARSALPTGASHQILQSFAALAQLINECFNGARRCSRNARINRLAALPLVGQPAELGEGWALIGLTCTAHCSTCERQARLSHLRSIRKFLVVLFGLRLLPVRRPYPNAVHRLAAHLRLRWVQFDPMTGPVVGIAAGDKSDGIP